MKVHTIDDYTVLSIHCSHCNLATNAGISADTLYLLHRDHAQQVTVSLLTPSRGPIQSILRIRLSPRSTSVTGARLIQSNGRETTVYPAKRVTGFSQQEIAHLVGQKVETFVLPGGCSLVIRPLNAGAQAGPRNKTATEMLRLAANQPRGDVRGDALLFHPDEI